MLPNTLGSTSCHYNRQQRARHLSGNNSVSRHILQQGPHSQVNPHYFRHRQDLRDHSNTSDYVLHPNEPIHLPRRPKSADPSSQRTTDRLESLRNMHGGPLFINERHAPINEFPPSNRHLIGGSTSNLPLAERFSHLPQSNYDMHLSKNPVPGGNPQSLVPVGTQFPYSSSHHPHHHHEVLYVCHGQCTGPRCDFSKSTRQLQSRVYLDPAQQAIDGDSFPTHFRSAPRENSK